MIFLDSELPQHHIAMVLQWLIDPSEDFRGSGRTTELIHAHIAVAIRHRRTVVRFQDHYAYADKSQRKLITDALMTTIERDYPGVVAKRISDDEFAITDIKPL